MRYQELLKHAEDHLRRAHPAFAEHIINRGGCTLKLRKGAYQVLCHSIISQQISTLAAKSIGKRVLAFCGGRKFDPQVIVDATEEELRGCGLSRGKVRYLKALSQKALDEPKLFASLTRMTDEEILKALLPIPGIGPWTIEMFLMFSLGRLDVLPVADLGIQKGFQKVFGLDALPKKQQMVELSETWRPYRSIACWFLWSMQDPVDWP